MIVASLLLILVAVTLLVFGVAGGSSMLLISSIVASLLAAIALVAGARRASARRAAARDVGGGLRAASGSTGRTGARGRGATDAGGGSPHAESAAFADRMAPAAAGSVAYAGESGAPGPAGSVTYADEPGDSDPAGSATYPDESGGSTASGSTTFPDEPGAPGDDEYAAAGAVSGSYPEAAHDELPGSDHPADQADADLLDTGADADYPPLTGVDADYPPHSGGDADYPPHTGVDADYPPHTGVDADYSPLAGVDDVPASGFADDLDVPGSSGTEPESDHTGHRDYDHASSVIDAARTQDPDESWRREPDAVEHSDTGAERADSPAFTVGAAFDEPVEEFGEPDPDDPADEPLPQAERAADAVRIARMDAEVLVVDGRPRYHVADCPHLVGRLTEPLPVAEAVELGFTPCGLCRPVDRLLAAAARR
ncbi:hypothetical protein [Krasilnikovia sp. M28-CT-15]|uniref:hypothetical protein n=1 Tax=Krasilnikovia sp. M28-CT-15 TaxID=3373540 RepID=UPI003876EAFC